MKAKFAKAAVAEEGKGQKKGLLEIAKEREKLRVKKESYLRPGVATLEREEKVEAVTEDGKSMETDSKEICELGRLERTIQGRVFIFLTCRSMNLSFYSLFLNLIAVLS